VSSTPRVRGLPLLGVALAGLVLGHALAYALAVPDPLHRDLLLERTGHAYLPLVGEAAMVLLLAGVAALVARSWSSRGRRDAVEGFAPIAGLLAAVQVTAFLGQEVLERLVAGAPLSELGGDHVLSIGIGVQVGTALVGAVVLRWLARTSARLVEAVRAVRAALPRPRLAVAMPMSSDRPRGRTTVRTRSARAPPSR
jgi:hypothetical protein